MHEAVSVTGCQDCRCAASNIFWTPAICVGSVVHHSLSSFDSIWSLLMLLPRLLCGHIGQGLVLFPASQLNADTVQLLSHPYLLA